MIKTDFVIVVVVLVAAAVAVALEVMMMLAVAPLLLGQAVAFSLFGFCCCRQYLEVQTTYSWVITLVSELQPG